MAESFNYPFRVGSSSSYGEALTQLNNKLESIKKNVSYFDFYNITSAVTNIDTFSAQLNNLPVNESLVINTPPFHYNHENYSTGDVIIKNHLGEVFHIKSQTGGVFYPQKIEGSNGSYVIHFGFSGSAPTLPESNNIKKAEDGTITYDSSAPFAIDMKYAGLQSIESSSIYGIWQKLTYNTNNAVYICSFPIAKIGSSIINPSLQFYLCKASSDIPEEQIYIEYNLSRNETQWTVSVAGSLIPGDVYVKVK